MITAFAVALLGIPAGWATARLARAYGANVSKSRVLGAMTITGAVFTWAAFVVPATWLLAPTLILAWVLIALAAIDLAVLRLPDPLTLPLMVCGLAVSFALSGAPIVAHLLGAAAGYASLALLAMAWRRWRNVEGIGLGDAKLLGAGGAWLGWQPLPTVVLIACAVAFAFLAVMVVAKGRAMAGARIAFGAPLSLAIWIVWLYGAPYSM